MQVFRTEWLVTLSGSPAFFAALVKSSPILFFPRGARLYHTGTAGFLLWFIVRKTGRKAPRVSSFLHDDGWRSLDTNGTSAAYFSGAMQVYLGRTLRHLFYGRP